jgi:hypothetical protein
MAASAEALLHFVAVAHDAAASSVAQGLRQKAAIGAAESDGGKHASAVNQGADAPDKVELTDLCRVGIGTAAPVATPDVYKGEVKVGSSGTACTEV